MQRDHVEMTPYVSKRNCAIIDFDFDKILKEIVLSAKVSESDDFGAIYTIKTNKKPFRSGATALAIKMIHQHTSDPDNNAEFTDFIDEYPKHHKFVVFYDATDKVFDIIDKKYTNSVEAFDSTFLMIDNLAITYAPSKYEIVAPEEIKHILNQQFAKIHKNDPGAKYFGAQKGDIIRIVDYSQTNGFEVRHRKVIDRNTIHR